MIGCSGPDPAPEDSEGGATGTSEVSETGTSSNTSSSSTAQTTTEGPTGSGSTAEATTSPGSSSGATTSSTGTGVDSQTTDGTSTSTGSSTDTDTDTDTDTGGVEVLPSEGCGLPGQPTGKLGGQKTSVNGTDRSYDLFVPGSYDENKPHALVFTYHGAGGTANTNQFRLEKNSTANDNYSINVAPQGWPSDQWELDHFVPFNLEESVTVFDQVVDELAANYCVDLNRIFVFGHSNGGQMAFHLGCLRGDRIRGIFPSGGRCFSYGPGVCDPYNGPMSQQCEGSVVVTSVMGEDDVTRHADEEATLAGYRARQGCSASTEPVDPSPCLDFQGCESGAEVASCRIPGLAHALWKDGHDPIYQRMMSL